MLARQAGVAKRWQQHLIASPFGTIHAAMFSLPRPVGTAIPHPPIYALANFDPTDITGSIGKQPLGDETAPLQFPKANRKAKGNSLVSRPREPLPPLPPVVAIEPVPETEVDASLKKSEGTGRFDPYSQYEFVTAPDEKTTTPDVDLPYADIPPANLTPTAPRNATGKEAAQLSLELIRWRVAGSRSRLGHRVKRQSCWPRMATRISNSQHLRLRRMATPRVVKVSPAKVKSPASINGLGLPRNDWRSLAQPVPRPKNVSPMRYISKRAVNRSADKSPLRRS